MDWWGAGLGEALSRAQLVLCLDFGGVPMYNVKFIKLHIEDLDTVSPVFISYKIVLSKMSRQTIGCRLSRMILCDVWTDAGKQIQMSGIIPILTLVRDPKPDPVLSFPLVLSQCVEKRRRRKERKMQRKSGQGSTEECITLVLKLGSEIRVAKGRAKPTLHQVAIRSPQRTVNHDGC